MKRITVHDVVNEAKVSLATVDRVLNNRPGVRIQTIKRVTTAIEKLGYRRDISAANLAKRREYRIRFILPAGDNSFMNQIKENIYQLALLEKSSRTFIDIVEVTAFDSHALTAALDSISADIYTGVVFVAVDSTAVSDAVHRLKNRKLIPVTIVSDIPGAPREHFVGINNIAAGRTAASLLGKFLTMGIDKKETRKIGEIALVVGSMLLSDHYERRLGFEQVLKSEYPNLKVAAVIEGEDNNQLTEKKLDRLFKQYPNIVGLYNLGAAKRGVLKSLKKFQLENKICAIAHDLTIESRMALLDGTFDAIIAQDSVHEVNNAIKVVKNLADNIPMLEERIGINIYLRDNLGDV